MKYPASPPGCSYTIELPDTLYLISEKNQTLARFGLWGRISVEPNYHEWLPTYASNASDTAVIKVLTAGCDPSFQIFARYNLYHLKLDEDAFVHPEVALTDTVWKKYGSFVFFKSMGVLRRAALVHRCDTCTLKIVDGDSLIATVDSARAFAEGAPERERTAAISATSYSPSVKARLIAGKAWIGMTAKQARLAWGDPDDINVTVTAAGRHEQWVYGSRSYLYLDNGLVTGLQK